MISFKSFLIATPVLVVMDLVWIGWIMAPFYQSRLRPLLNFVDGKLEPRIIPALLTYISMILLVTLVAVPLARSYAPTSGWTVFLVGALIGLLVYGLYNLTNLSIIRDWSTAVTIVDSIWGGVIFGTVTWMTWFFTK